jgi:hypothetical protein
MQGKGSGALTGLPLIVRYASECSKTLKALEEGGLTSPQLKWLTQPDRPGRHDRTGGNGGPARYLLAADGKRGTLHRACDTLGLPYVDRLFVDTGTLTELKRSAEKSLRPYLNNSVSYGKISG